MSGLRATIRRCTALIAVALLGLAGAVAPADAAQILDVRVARHPGFVRVVFDTDAPVSYRVESADGEVRVHVTADALVRDAYLPGADTPSVRLEPEPGGTLARIPLPGPVVVETQELDAPPRLVLDLRDRGPQPSAEAEPPAPTLPAAADPAAPATRDADGTAPAAPPATSPPPPDPPAPTDPSLTDPALTELTDSMLTDPALTERTDPALTDPALTEPTDPAPTEPSGTLAPPALAATSPTRSEANALPPPDVSAPPGRTPIPNTHRRAARPVLVPKTYVKFIFFAWVSLLALALLRRLRQRRLVKPPELQPNVRRRLGLDETDVSVEADDEPAPFRADPMPGAPERPSAEPATAPPPLRAPRDAGPSLLSALSGEEDDLPMDDLLRILQRLDARLARVEARLETLDRDRGGLARQSAAQAQELRSQRAALTRFQRALSRSRSSRGPTP